MKRCVCLQVLSLATAAAILCLSRGGASGQGELPPEGQQITLAVVKSGGSSHAVDSGFTLGEGTTLLTYGAPEIVLAGDADGDGRADFLGVNPQANTVDFGHMSMAGKLLSLRNAHGQFGEHVLAAACDRFTGGAGADTLGLSPNGAILVASGMRGNGTYGQMATATTLPADLIPKAPVRAVIGDFDGDGKPDVLFAGADGKLLFLHNDRGADNSPHFTPRSISEFLISGRRIAAGNLSGTGKSTLVWIDATGNVRRANMDKALHFDHPTTLAKASPDDGLAVGRFRGTNQADVIVGQRLLPGGVAAHSIPLPNLPSAQQAKTDLNWIAADFNRDGKDDLLRVEAGADPYVGNRLDVYYSHDLQDNRALQFDDTDNDGLPEAWETGDIHPGGLDLKAMGCSPRHADVIVEVQRIADVPADQLRSDMEKAVSYFAKLPVKNPDGTLGIALHLIYNDPIPMQDAGLSWWQLQAKYHVAAHRGITHWMSVYNGGGGQSSQMGDGGSFGRFGMPAVFIHEFGHQLGLDHTGRWKAGWCPTYPSLMNYAFSYQLNGKASNVGFSDGRLASVVLNERHLDEYLPLPMDKISYISGPPYFYRMKPAPDGKGTLIDWNWNGVFGEKDISADINYGYSTNGGERHVVGKTYTAPALTALGEGTSSRLLVFHGMLAPGTTVPAVSVKATHPSLSPDQPGQLGLRLWMGNDTAKEGNRWSGVTAVESEGVVGETSVTTLQQAAWAAYPTLKGIRIRRVTLDSMGTPQIGAATLVPDSVGVQPTLTSLSGRMALLLWRDKTRHLGLRWLDIQGDRVTVAAENALDFASNVPVGAAGGLDAAGKPALWIGLTQDQDKRKVSRWQIRILTVAAEGTVHLNRHFWTDGDSGGNQGFGRVTLLLEPEQAFGPEGRWYFLQRGGPNDDLGQDYIGMRIADKTMNGGCLTRRYYDEWTNSRSAPSACWYRGDMALSLRWFGDSSAYSDNNLFVAFAGRGIESEDMGDFNDLLEIRDYGLGGSIRTMTE